MHRSIQISCEMSNSVSKYILEIRQSCESDRSKIEKVHTKAFGIQESPKIADLVNGLLDDETAIPILSLVATENEKIIGHILFTKVIITQSTEPATASILAPVAVLPNSQAKGVGRVKGKVKCSGASEFK